MAFKKQSDSEIVVAEIKTKVVDLCILGTTPLIFHRLSSKAKKELLLPKGKKTSAEKASSLKHDPIAEYRDSVNKISEGPTYLGMPATAFKRAICDAALDIPGAKKAQIGRLVFVPGPFVPIYGIPSMMTCVTRSSDINHTPDVRTRAILKNWAAYLRVQFVTPIINETSIINLLVAAGFTIGIGDWRQQKGSGNYGLFTVTSKDDAKFIDIVNNQGREAQKRAIDFPEYYNEETQELIEWYESEVGKRGLKVAA